jgi:hypothetical protein
MARDLSASNRNSFYSSANGTSWTTLDSDMMAPTYANDTPGGETIRKIGAVIIVSHSISNGLLVSLDSGATWAYAASPHNARGGYLDFNAAGTRFVYQKGVAYEGAATLYDGTGNPTGWSATSVTYPTADVHYMRNKNMHSFGSDLRLCAVQIEGGFDGTKLGMLAETPTEFWTNLTNTTETIGG